MLCIIHAKHDSEDKQVGYWQFGCPSCMRNKIAALRAECERLKVEGLRLMAIGDDLRTRIAELEAGLTEIHELLSNYRHGKAKARAAAALKGDTSEIRRRASPDDKHPEDRIVH